ncbi:YtxH domain-containing protein [Bacillus piscicola]|uniref:YtxH domain-containing protein n=1 Tax=Bacillus piscicola TaxID=1632684 RepID=UPI001F09F603|nr:YtxH domain-containing protein [Bacillus piscicola]
MDCRSLLSGLFTGLVAGGLSALIFAPAPGSEMRTTIRDFDWKSLNRTALKKGKVATENWQYAALEGLEAVENLTEEMKKTYSRYKEEVEPEVAAIQEQVQELSDAITELNERARSQSDD